jgi:Rps23 Pro-64 3,4-dihydroxylase Tpa1-like proline 4-hydroxylase
MQFNFRASHIAADPFPHVSISHVIERKDADRLLQWMKTRAPWTLRVENFYQQYEFSFLSINSELEFEGLLTDFFIGDVAHALKRAFTITGELQVIDVGAHMLKPGQSIRIHNDFLDGEETHRLLIQLNEGWEAEHGGLLMLFRDQQPESLSKTFIPSHGSGFAFEISPSSFHAVSTVRERERFTIVYTFRARPG